FFFSIYIPNIDNQKGLFFFVFSVSKHVLFTATRPLDFNAATNAASGQTQNVSMGLSTLPTFGKKYDFNSVANEPLVWSRDVNVSDSCILGYPRSPAFGVSSNSHFGTPRLDSYSFGQPAVSMSGSKGKESTSPFFKISGFGKPTFGINQKGSRIASYTATPENNITGSRIQSICGMPTYKDKSQEELRFEDYQLGDKAFNAATNAISGLSQNIYPGSSISQTFGKKYDVNSMANEPLLWPRDSNVADFCAFGSLKASSFGVSSKTHTLARQVLIPIPLANQLYPCQGSKVCLIVHFLMFGADYSTA
ncbi:hypothetical protein AABB24_025080, partial [Solanum stoloniferum]